MLKFVIEPVRGQIILYVDPAAYSGMFKAGIEPRDDVSLILGVIIMGH